MSSVSFSGLSTGIDTNSMIDQLVSLESVSIKQMEARKQNYQSKISIVQNLNSKLQTLQTKAKELDTLEEFLSYETETSDTDLLSVSATGKANPGSYDIYVDKLATAERRYSTGYEDKEATGVAGAVSGTLGIKVGDEDVVNITIDPSDTLETIVSKINSADVEASAGLLFNGSEYYLQISGKLTGAENALVVTETNIDLGLENGEAMIAQAAIDAEIRMDTFTVKSATNEITTAIPGVTLTLQDVDPDNPVNVTISPNSSAIEEKIQGFVDAYNDVVSLIHDEFRFDGEAKGAGRLTGDSTLRSVQMQLNQMLSSNLDGLPGNFTALSQLGIKSDNNGELAIDSDTLSEAITDDARGVAEFFSGTSDHSVDGLGDKLDNLIDTFIDYSEGILTARVNGMNKSIQSINKSIENQEQYITKYEDKLRKQFTNMEVTMSSLMSQSNFMANQKFLW